MSGATRGQTSAASEYNDQENVMSRVRGSLKQHAPSNENQENLPPKQAAIRAVLGPLQNNQRCKNQRGTKQVGWRNSAQ